MKIFNIMLLKCLSDCPHVKSPSDTMLMWFVCKITAGFWFAWIESGKIYQTTHKQHSKTCRTPIFHHIRQRAQTVQTTHLEVLTTKTSITGRPRGDMHCRARQLPNSSEKIYIYESVSLGAIVHLKDGVVLAVATSIGLCNNRRKRDGSPCGSGSADESWGRTAGWGLWADDHIYTGRYLLKLLIFF